MPEYTNFLKPTSIKLPSFGSQNITYRVKTFDEPDIATLDAAINAFLDSLVATGQPYAHIVSIDHNTYLTTPPSIRITAQVVYFYMGDASV